MTTGTGARVRDIHVDEITDIVAELCERATHELPEDVVAGLRKAARDGSIPRQSVAVCILTGNGLKDPDAALRSGVQVASIEASADALARYLAIG